MSDRIATILKKLIDRIISERNEVIAENEKLRDEIERLQNQAIDYVAVNAELVEKVERLQDKNVDISMTEANSLLRSAWMIANRNGEQTNWEAFRNRVYKELLREHNMNIGNAKTYSDNNKLDAGSLEYAAKWIENSLIGETNERVIEFGKNMSMSIRAAKPSDSEGSVTQNDKCVSKEAEEKLLKRISDLVWLVRNLSDALDCVYSKLPAHWRELPFSYHELKRKVKEVMKNG